MQVARSYGFWLYASGLLFLVFIVVPVWADPNSALPQKLLNSVPVLLVAVVYLALPAIEDRSLPVIWAYLVVLAGAIGSLALVVGWQFSYSVCYLAIAGAILLPLRQALVVTLGPPLLACALNLYRGDQWGAILSLLAAVTGTAIAVTGERLHLQELLTEAERRHAALAATVERERIGRDLHDILGHSLTAVTVKAQLARRLVGVDDAAAGAEIAEVEQIARQALADVRATASGMRDVSVATELASARSVLLAAGVECRAPSATPLLAPELNELFGYAIREGVTNVVRHAEASVCVIDVDADAVTISDNGIGRGTRLGNGLRGLGERARGVGASVAVLPGDHDRGTRLRVARGAA